MKQIVFKTKGYSYIELNQLVHFQGELKKLSEINFNKLRKLILTSGFNFCVSYWENDGKKFIIDGHQRTHVLRQLQKQGYKFVDTNGNDLNGCVPCNPVEASSFEDAKDKVLQAVSQYGKIDHDGFEGFISDVNLDLRDYDFPDFELDIQAIDNEWKTDFDDVEKTQANLDGIPSIIKIVCDQDMNAEIKGFIKDALTQGGYEGLDVS